MIVSFAGLRALLIQKDVKHTICLVRLALRLRALLIQKDVKPYQLDKTANGSLRALLIQKDVKLSRTVKLSL